MDIPRNDAQQTFYLIGVKTESYYAAYQISYKTNARTILQMQAGVAVTDHVSAGELDYFSFYLSHSGKTTIQVSLTPVSPHLSLSLFLSL
jgi:hypothetical protein